MMEARFDENDLMLRPNSLDGCVRRRAAELALPELKRWRFFEQSDAELISLLMRHLSKAGGYEIAKSLESEGWCPDTALAEMLDGDFLSEAERELVAQWVICRGITLDLPIGTPVLWRGVTGTICRHDAKLAQYGVRTPDLAEHTSYSVNAEDVKLAAPLCAALNVCEPREVRA